MRVTSNTFPNTLSAQLADLTARQSRLQAQAATGQRIQRPEDDPVALRRVLSLQTESSAVTQYQRNIERQQELANATYGVMRSLKKISDRAAEIATLADDLKSSTELNSYATEITQLIKQAADLLNTKNRGDHLFAGTRSDQPPFVVSTDADGRVTAVAYNGNESLAETEISEGLALTSQVLGANSSGTGAFGLAADSRTGADLFAHLISLQDNLRSGDTAAIAATDRTNLAKDEDNILLHYSALGAVQSRLEVAASVAKNRLFALETNISNEADADLAQTMVRLNQTQVAYQAALQSGARILNLSLLDFLR